MASENASPIDPGAEAKTSASANDLPPQIRCDICLTLSHLPSLLNLAQASPAFIEPASSHVRTLKALGDLPGRAWDRFTCADGLKLLLNRSQQQQVSQLWQHTLERMPARVRRCVAESQDAAPQQQQAAQHINSIGSIIAAGLAVSACASHLQQLTIDAPVSTSEASQLMALLAALQRLELNQLCRTAIEEQVQQQQSWRPAHVPQGLLHLQLQRSSGQIIHLDDYTHLDARPFAAAKALQSLQLLAGIWVHTIMAFTEVPQLSSLTISCKPGLQVRQQMGALSTTAPALRHVSLPWYEWERPAPVPQVERLQVCSLALLAWPAVAVTSLEHLTLDYIFLELPEIDGCLTEALPALEVLEVGMKVEWNHALNAPLCCALSCHTALRSLRLPCEYRQCAWGAKQPWRWQQGLASISSLTQLQVLNLLADDVPGLLADIAACTALRELHLGLARGAWTRLSGPCRQQLRALQASSSSVCRCTIEGLGDE